MPRFAGTYFKKVFMISVFIFLFGLFSGLFFSIGLSAENTDHLASLFVSSITDTSIGPLRIFFSSLISDLTAATLILAAVLTNILCFLPFAVLWYKSFAIGFCCGLIHVSGAENSLILSITEILPPALFAVPGFILLASAAAICSKQEIFKSKRPSGERKVLLNMIFFSLSVIVISCIAEALCHAL